jgi:PAS domain S-box-containing protein
VIVFIERRGPNLLMSVAEPLVQASLVGEAIDRGPIAVFVADDDMRFVAANGFACEMLGYTRTELLELRMTDVARDDAARPDHRQMVTAGAQTGTIVLSRKNGDEVSVAYHAQQTTVAGLTFYVSVIVPNGSSPH